MNLRTRTPAERAVIYAGILGGLSRKKINELLLPLTSVSDSLPESSYKMLRSSYFSSLVTGIGSVAATSQNAFGDFIFKPKTLGEIAKSNRKVARFNPSTNHPNRAAQAWLILIGVAMNRQTLTYEELARRMYRRQASGVLDRVLGHIAFYCSQKKLPALTSLVVGKRRGTPGADIPLDPANLDRERERVYSIDWFDVCPPNPAQLKVAFEAMTIE